MKIMNFDKRGLGAGSVEATGSVHKVSEYSPSTKSDYQNIASKMRGAALIDCEGDYIGFQCGTLLLKCKNTNQAITALADRMEQKAHKAAHSLLNEIDKHKAKPISMRRVPLTDKSKEGIIIETCEEVSIEQTPAKPKRVNVGPLKIAPILDNWEDFYNSIPTLTPRLEKYQPLERTL